MKKVAVLGSTGSIGTQTLDVVRANDDLEVVGLAAGSNVEMQEKQLREFHPRLVAVWKEEAARDLAGRVQDLDVKDLLSMNMRGLTPDFIEILEKGFSEFLSGLAPEDTKKEYLLPELVDHLIKTKSAEVDVLETKDTWFGVTYQEDKETVMRAFKNLTEAGIYPQGLYQ